ncbi:MAG: hypothetical protein WA740_10080 [Candidatus Binataceae bacterium]
MKKSILSWGYVLAAIASGAAAIKTGDYRLLLGIPIAFCALFIVGFGHVVRTILDTASKDAAIPRGLRAIAWVLVRFAWTTILIWPLAFGALLFSDHFVGAWLVGTYIVASNTVRWYQAAYLPPIASSGALSGTVVRGETAAAVHGMLASFRGPRK